MRAGLLCWAVLLLLTAGCAPHAREPEQLALVRVLGVDGGGPVTVTGLCSPTEQGEPPPPGRAMGADLAQALDCLPWVGEQELALSHLSHVVLGDGASLAELLEELAERRTLSVTAALWQCGEAGPLLEGCPGAFERLELLKQGGVQPPTAGEVLAALAAGEPVRLPRLVEEDGSLRLVEEALWCREEGAD